MCVTNVYVDRYPDGKEIEFRHTDFCQYGIGGRPCQKLSTLENPVRHIQFGELSSEMIMNAQRRGYPQTPPRSAGNSQHRHSGDFSSEDGRLRRRHSKRDSATLRPHRQHRKERIIIVDSPPTPRTPPQLFSQTFGSSVPNSPSTPPFIIDGLPRERGRPIIVDERPLPRIPPRVPSIGAVVGGRERLRARSQSRNRFAFESPSSSHTSFDSRARREAESLERRERERKDREREERLAALETERRREARIRQQDEEIRRRPPIPVPNAPLPVRHRDYLRPVVDQSHTLQSIMGGLALSDRGSSASAGERALIQEAEIRRRMEVRDRELRAKIEAREEEAMKQRLRERQMPKRRSSVGPGSRRHRVLYDDGVYRWE